MVAARKTNESEASDLEADLEVELRRDLASQVSHYRYITVTVRCHMFYMHTHMHMHMHIHMLHMHMHMHTYTCMHMCMHVCMRMSRHQPGTPARPLTPLAPLHLPHQACAISRTGGTLVITGARPLVITPHRRRRGLAPRRRRSARPTQPKPRCE